MKKMLLFKKSLITILPISLGLGVVLGAAKNSNKEVKGYTAASLPTTIDLNDTSASNIRSYYSSLNNLSTSERQGTNLLKNLKTILKNGQNYFSYENGTNVWRMYEITDRDWDKSPASSTVYGTYNASTNTITGYTYGSSASSSKNNPYIHALYINRDVNNQTTAWDNHNQDEWGINREHVWPKAEGFGDSGDGGARGDPMHLMAGNGYSNNIHSNYYYGYVKTSSSYTDCGSTYSNQSGNLRGTSKTLNTGTVFEPQDCDKGDIARAIFYMVARYNYLSGSDSDGISTDNPNLTLTQSMSDWASSSYTSTSSNPGKMGIMTDLLAWHHADPVDEFEIHRNNLLYTNFTNNRNPFIDFPEWADFIWGSVNYNGSTYVSHSTTPTGFATPSSDTINGYNSGGGESEIVSVTGVTLNKESTSILVGESEALSATVAPSNATNQAVSWASSDTAVATISSSGRVTALAEGTTTITVTTSDGGYTATCNVSVTAASGGETEVSNVVFTMGEDGEAAHSDGSGAETYTETQSNITLSITGGVKMYTGAKDATGKGCLKFGTSSIDGSFTINLSGISNLKKVILRASNYKSNTGATVSIDGGTATTLTKQSNNGEYDEITTNITSQTSLSVAFAGRVMLNEIEFVFDVASDKTLDSISLDYSSVQTTFYIGDTFNYDELVVTANYDDSSSDIVSFGYNVTAPDMSTTGQKTVNVSYTIGEVTKSASYNITVNAVELTSISVDGYTSNFTVGDNFSFGGTVTANYNNGNSSNVTSSASFSGYNMSTIGTQIVTVLYGGQTTTYQITVSEASQEKGTLSNPYTVAEARAAIDESGTISNKYTKGIIYQIDSYSSSYNSITYWISDNGLSSTPLEIYSGKGLNGADFEAQTDLTVGDTVIVKGTLKLYNSSTYEYDKNSEIVSRTPLCDTSYSLVTDPSKLLTGDEVIIVGTKSSGGSSSYYTMAGISNKAMSCTQLAMFSSTLVASPDTMTFTIEKTESGHRFRNSDNQYLATCSNSANECALEAGEPTNNSLFNITYSNSAMSVIGVDSGSYSYKILRFYNRSGTTKFAFYQTTSGSAVSIYKKTAQVNADTWSETFLSSTSDGYVCNVNSWSTLASSYNELSSGAKDEIINVEANASELYSLRAQAMARYDYFMSDSRFNQGEHFIVGRPSSSAIRPSQLLSNDNDQTMVLICICTIVSLTSLTSLLIIKKRKNRRT